MTINLYTIGFTQKTAEQFFGLLRKNSISVLVDTRLKPDSQLSGFAKKRDLPYFLHHLCDCNYRYMSEMSPSDDLLSQYRGDKSWTKYEIAFNQLLVQRDLISQLERSWWMANKACLLCSEHQPDYCHRRLVAEYIASYWKDTEIVHLI
jgi:uncharacterized protein (DUF488 family)